MHTFYIACLCVHTLCTNTLPVELGHSSLADARPSLSEDSLVPRHQVFRTCPAALSKNRVWTRSLVKLGRNHTSVLVCCRTNQIAQVK